MPIAEFDDPRLAAIYDAVNTHDPTEQPRFVRRLADGLGAGPLRVVDIGCGTGLITRVLAGDGHDVIGVDPSVEMISVGRSRPFGDQVRWVVGPAAAVGAVDADLAIMTSHVAQFFVTDESWDGVLAAARRALRPGGLLGFESRNPGARAWEAWTPATVTSVIDPVAGPVDTWSEVHEVQDGVVRYANHYRFGATGEELVSEARLRFRTLDELTSSLDRAGFEVERVDGDWDGRPAGPTEREHIVTARRR